MNDKQARIVTEILEADSTLEKILIYKSGDMDGIQILLFDEEKSNMKGFGEKNLVYTMFPHWLIIINYGYLITTVQMRLN